MHELKLIKGVLRILLLIIVVIMVMPTVRAAGRVCAPDPTCGGKYFTLQPAGHLWRKIGPAAVPTVWYELPSGQGLRASYFVDWKLGAANPVPDELKIIRMLGTTFYYPKDAPPATDPSKEGYNANSFSIADDIAVNFPSVIKDLSKNATVRSCEYLITNYFLIDDSETGNAFLVVTPPTIGNLLQMTEVRANVAVLPVAVLGKSYDEILNNLSYYVNGGDVEWPEFAGAFYFLSRQTDNAAITDLGALVKRGPSLICPEFPRLTATGLAFPYSWKQATQGLKP